MSGGEFLFYGGIALMALAAVGALLAAVLLISAKKRLRLRLDEEFGKKRR